MKIDIPPKKPFSNFKWRWAVLTPTESLNDPSVFLGVLRVYSKYDGIHPGATEILNELRIVQEETKCSVDLVRTSERNLIRNSGQYWKALGLLNESHGKVSVTRFGKLLAQGDITKTEFATTIIKTFELPNKNIIYNTTEWDKIGLKIKPLQLILEILGCLYKFYGIDHTFITLEELIRIVIPLSGAFANIEDYCFVLLNYREGQIDISNFPDCAPDSNDKRMAREYLLFLKNYGYLIEDEYRRNKYKLLNISLEEINHLVDIEINNEKSSIINIANRVKTSQIPAIIERKMVSRELLERPYQSRFRESILEIYNSKCLITGVNIEAVLEAAHIIPIAYDGTDQIDNGICLRSDIHRLFDTGHLRIFPSGKLLLSESANKPENYSMIKKSIEIPEFINKEYLDWRIKYY